MNISVNIKAIRESKRLSQAEIARRMDIAPEFYFRLEKRGKKLSLEQIESIANALEVSVAELIGINVSDNVDYSDEISKLLKENGELKENSYTLSIIQLSYVEIFNEHIEDIENQILRPNSKIYYPDFYLTKEDILSKEDKLSYISFYVFLLETDFYEIAIRLMILSDNKIIKLWERFKFINPLCIMVSDIQKFRKISNDLNLNDDKIIIEIVKERAKVGRYKYLENEVNAMIEMYERLISSEDKNRMETIYRGSLVSSLSEIRAKFYTKLIDK